MTRAPAIADGAGEGGGLAANAEVLTLPHSDRNPIEDINRGARPGEVVRVAMPFGQRLRSCGMSPRGKLAA